MESDIAYFSRRAIEERTAAGSAADARARSSHLGLAHRYEELARAITKRDYDLGLDLYEASPRLRLAV